MLIDRADFDYPFRLHPGSSTHGNQHCAARNRTTSSITLPVAALAPTILYPSAAYRNAFA
jgi:hypothetical protein